MKSQATIAACLTPPGRGAIATLVLHGPQAWSLARELVRLPSPTQSLPLDSTPGRFWLGRMGESGASDEVVIAAKAAGPVPQLEIHCHGGQEVVRLLLDLLARRGAVVRSWEEFVRDTALDPLCAQAQIVLARAPTVRTASILLDQMHGALSALLRTIRGHLDHRETTQAVAQLDGILRFAGVGRHLVDPWRVVIAGAPNVGKSSLVNAIAGYERCIVSPTPGTTRDVVTTVVALDGWPVELADTAGWRTQAGPLEAQGIARAQAAAAQAELCVWVLDASTMPAYPAEPPPAMQLVINKIDLPAAWNLDDARGASCVSAKTGQGVKELCDWISRTLVPDVPPPGAAVAFSGELCAQLSRTRECCVAGTVEEARKQLDAMVSTR